jgi:hypothetical protein
LGLRTAAARAEQLLDLELELGSCWGLLELACSGSYQGCHTLSEQLLPVLVLGLPCSGILQADWRLC